MFTSNFRALFFFFDIVLSIGLYVTFMAIGIGTTMAIGNGTTSPSHGSLRIVAASYSVFMALYLLWDILERKSTKDPHETTFLQNSNYMGITSIAALLAWLGFQQRLPTDDWRGGLLAGILGLITLCFFLLMLQKRSFYRVARAAI